MGTFKLDSQAHLFQNKQQNSLLILLFSSGENCWFLKPQNSVFLFQNLTCLSVECFSGLSCHMQCS